MNWNREIVLATPTLTRVFFVLAASAFVLGLGSCADRATGPRELTFGHVGEPGSLFALSAEEFARRANERLDGFEVVVYARVNWAAMSCCSKRSSSVRLTSHCRLLLCPHR